MFQPCGEVSVQSTETRERKSENEIETGDCTSVPTEFGACSVQHCEIIFCSENVGGAGEDD